jgi:hypothetical protein
MPIYAAITIFVAAGWWRLVRHRRDVFLLAAPFYVAIYIVWPYDQGTRFFTPMLPVMWASAAAMLLLWRRRRSGRSGTARHWRQRAKVRASALDLRLGKGDSGPSPSCGRRARPAAAALGRRRASIVLVALLAAHTIIWPIYWADWLKSAGKSEELRPVAAQIAAAVGEKGGPGVFVGDTDTLRLLVCLAMDRDWPVVPAGGHVPPDARWVIASQKNASIEGFAPVQRGDGFILLQRK